MEEMGPLLSGTPYQNNSGCWEPLGKEFIMGGTPGGPRAFQGMPVTLIIIVTFRMIVIILVMIMVNIYIMLTKSHTLF